METTIPKQLASIIEAIPQLILAYEVGTIMGVRQGRSSVYCNPRIRKSSE